MLTEIDHVSASDAKFQKNATVIISEWAGLFGNHLFQLTNAIFICLKYQCRLDYPQHKFMKRMDINWQQEQGPGKEIYIARYFDPLDCRGVFPNLAERQFILYHFVRKILTFDLDHHPLSEDDQRLVLQIRSGDTFVPKPHPKYVPPPHSYYTKIMDRYLDQEIVIVCENTNNPVIESLAAQYDNCIVQSSDIVTDIQTIANATNLVFSCGTFGITFALLSRKLRRFYVNDIPKGILDFGFYDRPDWDLGFELVRFRITNYISFNHWKNTPEQVELLMHLPEENIRELNEQQEVREAHQQR